MSKIHLLPSHVISLIAAGEVVERPSSVIKELIENSIDAKATKITVGYTEGGKESMWVYDNGTGIEISDAQLLLTQHATSKILQAKDLASISTLGFRGEAMASIAAVSVLNIKSKTADAYVGFELNAKFGVQSLNQVALPFVGTQTTITNLFGNTPARLKFLKTTSTEQINITDTFLSIAFANPGIHFELVHAQKLVYSLPAVTNLLDRIHDVWGKSLTGNLLHINHLSGEINVSGFISGSNYKKSETKVQYILVNGRRVADRTIHRAIMQAYEQAQVDNLNPAYFININLPFNLVDTNVHPRKLEVRFSTPGQVFSAVFNPVLQRLKVINKTFQAAPNLQVANPVKSLNTPFQPSYNKLPGVGDALSFSQLILSDLPAQPYAPSASKDLVAEINFKSLVVFNTYLAFEHLDEFIFLDWELAIQKSTYLKLIHNLSSKTFPQVIKGVLVDLSTKEYKYLLQNINKLNALGIQVTDMGQGTLQVTEFPGNVEHFNILKCLEALSNRMLNFELTPANSNLADTNPKMNLAVIQICKTTIYPQLNDLENLKIVQILNDFLNQQIIFSDFNSKPISWVLPKSVLEREFKRKL